MSYKLTDCQFREIFKSLSSKYILYGPRVFTNKAEVSDTDYIGYGELSTYDDLVTDMKSYFSPKEIAFPVRETLFTFDNGNAIVPEIDRREIIVFLRACDINGFKRLDKIFIENGNQPDYYYSRLRERLHFFLIECDSSFDNCFCVNMGSNSTENYSAGLKFKDEIVMVEVRESGFDDYFLSGNKCDYSVAFISENSVNITVPDPESIDEKIFYDEIWEEYTRRCIACGRCNTSCITCSCFTMQDTLNVKGVPERRRRWAGCHVQGFTDMAGGHNFRKKHGERMRFKALHKISDFKKRFGFNMCVGCGRCDDVCPEYISFAKCIDRLGTQYTT